MKKNKLLTGFFAISLATITPISLILTSCNNKNKIDIQTNPNIKIECKEITVGKELVINYTLDTDYGFDLEKSTITFGDSNGVVSLLECEVDREAKTITVPAKHVTSQKVKIDIKAENTTSAKVTKPQYNDALSNLINYTNKRAFKITGTAVSKQYDQTGKEISSLNGGLNINADGFKDYLNQTIDGVEQPIIQYWGEKDAAIGAWQYSQTNTSKDIVKIPATRSFASAFLEMLLVDSFPGYDAMKYDTLYNAYYAKWSPKSGTDWAAALKFDANHKLSSIAYTFTEVDEYSHSIDSTTCTFGVEYTAPTITIPSQSTLKTEMIYENHVEYKYENNQLECAIHENGLFGKFDIPLNKFTDFDKTKDLVMQLDKNANVGGCEACVTINGAEVSKSLFTFDDTKYVLTINKDAYSSLSSIDKLQVIIGNPGFGGASYTEAPKKFIICQEIETKSVTLTPNQQFFQELGIPLKNYNAQTITNEAGKTGKASWDLDTVLSTEQRYAFNIETSSGTITKTISLDKNSTAFEFDFTNEEWKKLTNGAQITVEPDYVDKTCFVVPQKSFLDQFDNVEIDQNPVVEHPEATLIVISANPKTTFQKGKAYLVAASAPSKRLSETPIENPASTYTFNLNVYGEQWPSIPYGDTLQIHYEIDK